VTENFTGSWAACLVCADLFGRGKMRALLDRSVAALGPLSPREYVFYRDRVARIHSGFLASGPHSPREGPQRALHPADRPDRRRAEATGPNGAGSAIS
jgi:hypothetical protein